MRIWNMVAAAGMVTASIGVAATADAQQRHVVVTRTVHRTVVTQHRPMHRPHCRTVWKNHHRVRRCA